MNRHQSVCDGLSASHLYINVYVESLLVDVLIGFSDLMTNAFFRKGRCVNDRQWTRMDSLDLHHFT